MSNKEEEKKPAIVRLIQFGLLGLGLALALSLVRNIIKTNSAVTRLDRAQERQEELEQENLQLKRQLEVVKTDQYTETEARNKLGLAKEGEYILILPEEEILRRLSPRRLEGDSLKLPDPNWKKWYKLFFEG